MKGTTIRSRLNPKLEVSVIGGHFATRHSHNNHYIDITRMKHEHTMAREAAVTLAQRYAYEKGVDTIVCLDGSEVLGAFLARHLAKNTLFAVNSDKNINVITPEYDSNGQLLFRDNLIPMVASRNVLLLISTVNSGKSIRRVVECAQYYGGRVQGIAAVFSTLEEMEGVPIYSLFTPEDIPGYATYAPESCAMCRGGKADRRPGQQLWPVRPVKRKGLSVCSMPAAVGARPRRLLREARFNFEHLVNFRPRGLLFGVKEYTILYENKTERARGAEPVAAGPRPGEERSNMARFQIVSDSSCDLGRERAERLGVTLVSFYVSFDGETYYREERDITNREFYQQMADRPGVFPRTSMPTVEDYLTVFRPMVERGEAVLCVCLNAPFSGSFQAARNARRCCWRTFPMRRSACWTPSWPPCSRAFWCWRRSICGTRGYLWRPRPLSWSPIGKQGVFSLRRMTWSI